MAAFDRYVRPSRNVILYSQEKLVQTAETSRADACICRAVLSGMRRPKASRSGKRRNATAGQTGTLPRFAEGMAYSRDGRGNDMRPPRNASGFEKLSDERRIMSVVCRRIESETKWDRRHCVTDSDAEVRFEPESSSRFKEQRHRVKP